MNISMLECAVTNIEDDLVLEADKGPAVLRSYKKKETIKLISLAACLLLLASGALLYHVKHRPLPYQNETVSPDTQDVPDTNEAGYLAEQYLYHMTDGPYASYVAGKVIDEALVGEKISETTVSAAWHYYDGEGHVGEEELLRADVYEIKDIPKETAVCIRFLDKGDALTTTHYYVQINPAADPGPVKDYLIGASSGGAKGDVTIINGEAIITYTSSEVTE